MPNDEISAIFRDRIQELLTSIRERFNAVLNSIGTGENLESESSQLGKHVKQLISQLPKSRQPGWLTNLHGAMVSFSSHTVPPEAKRVLLWNLIAVKPELEAFAWQTFQPTTSSVLDIDEVIRTTAQHNQVDVLYDKVIATLKAMLEDDLIDSLRIRTDLSEILAGLEISNRPRDYFSKRFSWEFAKLFLKFLVPAALKQIPVLSPLVESFEKASEELDRSFTNTDDDLKREIRTRSDAWVARTQERLSDTIRLLSIKER